MQPILPLASAALPFACPVDDNRRLVPTDANLVDQVGAAGEGAGPLVSLQNLNGVRNRCR